MFKIFRYLIFLKLASLLHLLFIPSGFATDGGEEVEEFFTAQAPPRPVGVAAGPSNNTNSPALQTNTTGGVQNNTISPALQTNTTGGLQNNTKSLSLQTNTTDEEQDEVDDSDEFAYASKVDVKAGSADEYKKYQESPEFKKMTEERDDNSGSEEVGPHHMEMESEFLELAPELSETWLAEIVCMHNALRKLHGLMQLEVDYQLAYHAQVRAEELGHKSFEAGNITLEHEWSATEGENEGARRRGSREDLMDLNGTFPAIQWYRELANHDWTKNEYDWDTRHFTQVVWHSTTRIGCGRFVTENDKPIFVAVCRYGLAGNWQDKPAFALNVNPAVGVLALISNNTLPDFQKIGKECIGPCSGSSEDCTTTTTTEKTVTPYCPGSSEEEDCTPCVDDDCGGGETNITTTTEPYDSGETNITTTTEPYDPGETNITTTTEPYDSGETNITTTTEPYDPGETNITTTTEPYDSGETNITTTTEDPDKPCSGSSPECPPGLSANNDLKICEWPGDEKIPPPTSTPEECPPGLFPNEAREICEWPDHDSNDGNGNCTDGDCDGCSGSEESCNKDPKCPEGLILNEDKDGCDYPGHKDPVKPSNPDDECPEGLVLNDEQDGCNYPGSKSTSKEDDGAIVRPRTEDPKDSGSESHEASGDEGYSGSGDEAHEGSGRHDGSSDEAHEGSGSHDGSGEGSGSHDGSGDEAHEGSGGHDGAGDEVHEGSGGHDGAGDEVHEGSGGHDGSGDDAHEGSGSHDGSGDEAHDGSGGHEGSGDEAHEGSGGHDGSGD